MRWQSKLTPANPIDIQHLGFAALSLSVYNMTPYPIFVNYSGNPPTANSYDLIIPAATSLSQRLPGNQSYAMFMDTSGVLVTFISPPAVLTFDSEADATSFAQVHLTYPYSSNLQFLARTQQIDQYVYQTQLGGVAGLLVGLSVPVGELWVVRRVRVRCIGATANNQAYVWVGVYREPAVPPSHLIYRYFSTADNDIWFDVDGLNVVIPETSWGGNGFEIYARNFGANPITYEVHVKMDIVQARLP